MSWNVSRVRASAGELDSSFGLSGKVTTNLPGEYGAVQALALQPDGKLFTAGYSSGKGHTSLLIARYTADGILDPTFGSGGIAIIDPVSVVANALAILPDGKILAAGSAIYPDDSADFAIARLNPDGSIDSSFGTDGIVLTDFFDDKDRLNSIAVQSDGQIVAAGRAQSGGYSHFALARYNSDGSLDPTFGNGGKITPDLKDLDDSFEKVIVQPDGRLVVAARTKTSFGVGFLVYRYKPNGKLDRTFGRGGKVSTDFPDQESATSIALTHDGRIVAAGYAFGPESRRLVLARYNTDGSLDKSFGAEGKVVTEGNWILTDFGYELVIQPDGRIVLGGTCGDAGADFSLVRYNFDGSLDSSFGSDRKIITDFGHDEWSSGLAITPDGRILASGSSVIHQSGGTLDTAIVLACYVNDLETAPQITRAEFTGKDLYVYGENFDDRSKLFVEGEKQKTLADPADPTKVLIGKKTGKKISSRETVTLRVMNGDNRLSNQFVFTRPV